MLKGMVVYHFGMNIVIVIIGLVKDRSSFKTMAKRKQAGKFIGRIILWLFGINLMLLAEAIRENF